MGNCSNIHTSTPSIIQLQDASKSPLLTPWRMKSSICIKSQPSLFDYDEYDLTTHKVVLEKSGRYVSTSKEINVFPPSTISFEKLNGRNLEMELDIHLTDEALEIKASNPGKDLWSVFRKKGSNKLNKSELKERNIIKLGNFLCFVRKINLQNIKKPNERSEDNSLNSQFDDKEVIKMSQNIRQCTSSQPYFLKPKPEEIEKEERICRICLNEENSEINPLINPCRCSGSMKWIHLKCLRKWLFNKVELVEDEIIRIYAWKDLNCELCKGPLKTDLVSEDSQIQLLDMKAFTYSYISFVSLEPDDQKKYYLFLLNLDKQKEINVGRFTECDLRINEISVSRYHSKIYKENNKVFIEDLQSKFGTLIKVPEQGVIIDKRQKGTFRLQMGRCSLQISNV